MTTYDLVLSALFTALIVALGAVFPLLSLVGGADLPSSIGLAIAGMLAYLVLAGVLVPQARPLLARVLSRRAVSPAR